MCEGLSKEETFMNYDKKRTPEEMVEILHSLKKIIVNSDDPIEFVFEGEDTPCAKTSFEYGSFTRKILEIIDDSISDSDE